MSFLSDNPIGPGWFIFFQDKRNPTDGGSAGATEGKFIKPGIATYNKYNVQSNNTAILLAELGVI